MVLELTNTLGGVKAPFEPLEEGRARMYHCGPTVKEAIHIEKFRSYLLADVLRRYLEREGYEVTQVMNITDVGHLNEFEEDIVEVAAARTGLYAWELAEREEKLFHEERRALHILDAHHYPRAREHIDDMIAFIQELERRGLCYRAGGNLYLDVSKHTHLGELAGKPPAALEESLRRTRTPPHPEKRHPLDIDLWRTDVLHQMHWDSPWGKGFPGWHVECAVMSRKYLGDSFDIHTGTEENIFPHHECERAQVELLTGKPLARYWLHTGRVHVDGKPMTPQNRNMVTVREILAEGVRGVVIRAALLSAHYRDILHFDEACLDRAREAVNQFVGFANYLEEEARGTGSAEAGGGPRPEWIERANREFQAAIENDLDYWGALSAVVRAIDALEPEQVGPPRTALEAVRDWDRVLGLL